MRIFSLRNDRAEIQPAVVAVFRWAALDTEIAHQIGFEEQYLHFHKYLLENLQSVPQENPHYTPRIISLSLRAGAVKAYIIFACSIIEGVLANWGKVLEISNQPEMLSKKPFGALLKAWCVDKDQPRREIAAIWDDLNLLLEYRNFIHLGKAVASERAYWQDILNKEDQLLSAVDRCLGHLADSCSDA